MTILHSTQTRKAFTKEKFRSIISVLMVFILMTGVIPGHLIAKAEAVPEYPYAIFALSDASDSISINSSNVNLNGSIATNGTVASESNSVKQNSKEHVAEEMFCTQKIESVYFSNDSIAESKEYVDTALNIHVEQPLLVNGSISLKGNADVKSSGYRLRSS